MSIVLDPTVAVEFRPRDDGPTYLLRPPTVADRIRYGHALKSRGAQFHANLTLMALARAGLERLLPGEDNAEALAAGLSVIDAYTEALNEALSARQALRTEETDQAFRDALTLPDELVELLEAISDRDDALRTAVADNAVYWSWAGLEAARMFLAGWAGLGRFKSGLSGPTEETLKQIPPGDLELIGVHVESMMRPDEARIKNSDLPSSGPAKETKSSSVGKSTRQNGHSADVTATA